MDLVSVLGRLAGLFLGERARMLQGGDVRRWESVWRLSRRDVRGASGILTGE